ncbi:MAG: hypothetical protein COA43_13065 [Robiginitomaculum sp.]|nr:MAG: hypothetical protein COA43_13065 [Robiginitomaculum sp.]
MLQTLKLLLPALIPSWRFFDTIAPSPRIEFRLLENENQKADIWQEFRPRPANLSILTMLKRMFWNPYWNESLFLVSCAERIINNQSEQSRRHSSQEIFSRIQCELERERTDVTTTPYLQFRLVFVLRNDTQIEQHITYISALHNLGVEAS